MKDVISYYDDLNNNYAKNTVNADMSEAHRKFEDFLPSKALVLDLGCGSGRDSKHFLEMGYDVTAIDPSSAMCEFASDYTGLSVRQMGALELTDIEAFDGVWACASLLHIAESTGELGLAMENVVRSLKYGGILYASWKLGMGERYDSAGRFFADMNGVKLSELCERTGGLEILDMWESNDVRAEFNGQNWINLLAKKG